MKTRIWLLAGVSLLSLSISAQILADDNNPRDSNRGNANGGPPPPQQQQRELQQNQQNQQRQQQQIQQQQNQQQRQQQQFQQREQQQQNQERSSQQRDQQERQQRQQQQEQQDRQQQQRQEQQQQQQRQTQERQQQERQLQDRQTNLPIQPRPNETRQTQQPRQGFYEDIPRGRHNDSWRAGNDRRPDFGHGNGWGDGPRYRPGYEIDRVPGGYSRVPYRGQDYFYSSGYWYRPQGPRYIVVEPPRGARVRNLPDYAQQVWLGSALFFLAAGTYYTYEQNTQEYVVAQPPENVQPVYSPPQAPPPQQQQQQTDPYGVPAYPANGQGPEQVQQDRYDCYNYAVSQSNFNPSTATYAPAPEVLNVYQQSMASCLVGRGYNVN
ncbi:DUF6515 family protein [Pseudomonas huanghezhanensis]|uniref:DUF6515 family protein n=1 Tax=Pseudomonas huanghezhanensis TaxID=3002903 RepID=UPI0022857EAB|nr:DUF6515 family protein [Pseudomonas sp. BSw22131]